jgi:hypothetical protein
MLSNISEMKVFLRIVIFLLICVLLGFWSPWLSWKIDLSSIFNVESPDPIAGLEVYSLVGDLQVSIEGVVQEGIASAEEGSLIIDGLEPGEKAITITRISDIENAYWEYRGILTFTEGVNTVISLGIGPEKEFSEGTIITAVRKNSEDYNLKITSEIPEYQVLLENVPYNVTDGEFTSNLSLDRQYTVRINKSGYESLEFSVLPEDQESRSALENYIIEVDVFMLLQPVQIE